ncbi:uncharacterized protein C2orf78-like [Orycteropus afer afer]|uniref:Uncharacterized protein C2orf78-like n=1 Tax=Orycteropus afer afer TaxID=1230840 RepID=A0A8B6ZBQ9_ORYAF|nr:uncharacterized protein C2orf78-like [Orycteropus afer afer]
MLDTRSLASVTQTTSSIVSSILVSTFDISSSLTMSENFQNPSLLGTPNSLELSLPVVSSAAPLTGNVCSLSRVSAPAVSSAWLLPSAPSTSFQPLMSSGYLYQHSSTTMLSGVSGQSQISTSSASYPGIIEWDVTRSTEMKSSLLRELTVTVIDQDAAISSRPMAVQYDKPSDTNSMVPLYPSLSASLVQGTPNQGHSLSLPYQEGSQVYYYNQGTLGSLVSGELGPCLQSYGSVTYTGGRGSAPQPEMVMVLKEVQPTDALLPASTSGSYYSVSTQPITETSFQVTETSLGMETSVRFQPPSQTFCLPQTPEFLKSCSSRNIQIFESNPPSELGDTPVITTGESSSNLLALPPAPSQERTENKNFDEIESELLKPLDAYQIPIDHQDPPLLPLEIPDIHQFLACIDPFSQEEQCGSENADLGKNHLSLEVQGTSENGIESSSGFADITTLVKDIHLPQLFKSLEDPDQSKGSKVKDTKSIMVNQGQEKSSVIKGSSDQVRKNKHKTSEPITGAPKAKIPAKNPEGDVVVGNAEASGTAPVSTAKHSNNKPQKAAASRISKTKGPGQEKAKRTRESNPKKAEDSKHSGNKVKAEDKPTIPKMKRKKNQPDLSQVAFKKPRSCLGMHMLESVQVFHALGKKNDKKTGLPSSRAMGNSSNTKDPRPSPAIKPWLDKEKRPEKTEVKAQKPDGGAENQYELPPPGKVKLVPLPFLTSDKPQPRPVPRRPQSLASHRPSGAYPPRPGSVNSTQPTAINPSRPAPASASCMGPTRPAQPISTSQARPGVTNPARPSIFQSVASRPAPYKKSPCTSFQREPAPATVTKPQSPPKAQNQYLLEDFGFQPIPWRKPNVPEPVMSTPITEEQRPEREAMKRKAQRERENAAKYTSLGKVQFFVQREKDMEIAQYYGYAM